MAQSNAGLAVAPARGQTERASSIWKDHWIGIALAIGIAALAGVLVSVTLPRGPTTQTQALLVLLSGVIVGVLAGLAMRSRWAMLLAPLIHIAALELARPHLLGPTVGTIRLDTVYGMLAFLLGRGLYALVAIVPMILGAYLGAVLAYELIGAARPSRHAFLRWTPAVLATADSRGVVQRGSACRANRRIQHPRAGGDRGHRCAAAQHLGFSACAGASTTGGTSLKRSRHTAAKSKQPMLRAAVRALGSLN